MKRNFVKIPSLIMLLVLVLISCKKDKLNDIADADVYVKTIFNDGEPVFGIVHYVFGYSKMSSVIVEFPGGTEDQLTAYDSGKTVYYRSGTINWPWNLFRNSADSRDLHL